jgi:aryl-alcohol dehydrogenase-like predicted oxidoreductase
MYATPEGTQRFVAAQPESRRTGYRQTVDQTWVSSIGMGAYLGHPDDHTDGLYTKAFDQAIQQGCNLFDLAINYRFQRSERAFGAWLKAALASGTVRRDEIVIATKGGFVPYDNALPTDPGKWTHREFIATGVAHANDFVANYQHCMAPSYLERMIAWSQRNLGVETIDIYYLHNPETQRMVMSRETFRARLLDAIETLELAVEHGSLGSYGLATWTALRVMPDMPDYLSLTEMVGLAVQVAGQHHHLRYVQLPYNLFMTEAFAAENQQVGSDFESAIAAAETLGLTVTTSAPLMQGRLANPLMPELAAVVGLETDAQRAIQFARSSPGVTSTIVGMKTESHVGENLKLLNLPPMAADTIRGLYTGQ